MWEKKKERKNTDLRLLFFGGELSGSSPRGRRLHVGLNEPLGEET